MKKLFVKKLFLLSSLFFIISSFGYTSEDTSNANYLADQGVITKQTVASKYGMDNKILRQEVIAMALKIKGIAIPTNTACKKYFADATKNDWVCRAVELAADNGIITRSNKYANPSKYVTRAEALAMILPKSWEVQLAEFSIEGNEWQSTTLIKYLSNVLDWEDREKSRIQFEPVIDGMGTRVYWKPNSLATRAEVFVFAKNIIFSQDSVSGIERYGITDYDSNYKDFSGMVFDYAFGPEVPAYGDETKMTRACTVDFVESPEIGGGFSMLDFISQNTNINTPIVMELSGENKVPTLRVEQEHVSPPGIKMVFMKNADTLSVKSWGIDCVELMDLSDVFKPNAFVILSTYYHNITSWNIESAYSMRSPTGVSLETFQSWYENIEKVDIHYFDGTFKDLGNNTYEFLVDMTEKGVTSTYKVKSKVNLEKFTIDNISSVKI